ncbi:plasma kallikrein [Brachionus plicatilis]|uniref:Plasma kallikrein n=1 Tax=Brachionus plicatilis TaxID=10195 RepID=A0A3M7QLZ6_BRAPC|nr:plasma kallikrein [Brachionus plicatilis]
MSWATGWGYLEFQGKTSNILMEMESKILYDSLCKERYKTLNVSIFDSSINVCAGRNGKSICVADSGGPLVVKVDGKWQLAGISSWSNDWILSYIQINVTNKCEGLKNFELKYIGCRISTLALKHVGFDI